MLIVCPSCATSYDVKSADMPLEGRKVRCQRCHTVWHAEPSHADKVLAAAAAISPEHEGAAGAGSEGVTGTDEIRDDALAANDEDFAGVPAEEGGPAPAAGEDIGRPIEPAVDAPPIAPVEMDDPQSPIEIDPRQRRAAPIQDVETIAAQRHGFGKKRSAFAWPLSRLQTAVLGLVLVDAIIIGWRVDLVRALPQTASFYALLRMPVNFRGLVFDGIATATEQHEGVPILVIEGNIVNVARKIIEVPRLKFIVRNAAHQEIYSWTAVPARPTLIAGDALSFRTRLASPPPEAKDILVRFVTRRDLIAGAN